jgi:hypothetical protein
VIERYRKEEILIKVQEIVPSYRRTVMEEVAAVSEN